jgi:hypothetical protein
MPAATKCQEAGSGNVACEAGFHVMPLRRGSLLPKSELPEPGIEELTVKAIVDADEAAVKFSVSVTHGPVNGTNVETRV